MRVLHVAAEVAPFVKVGGLSQVMYFLPKAQVKLGMDVRIFTAKYGDMQLPPSRQVVKMHTKWLRVPIENDGLPVRGRDPVQASENKDYLICNVMEYHSDNDSIVYFLENREYYELRANVFGYTDDHIRFALLCKGALEWLLYAQSKDQEAWIPDVIHCHDWHTGYLVDWAKRSPRYKEMLKDTRVVFSVHNFAYQGNYDFRYSIDKQPDDGKRPVAGFKDARLQKQNALLRGIVYADGINTVSPTHAREVLTPEFAEGLEETLHLSRSKLVGIMNGLDFEEFDPESDKYIYRNFSSKAFIKAKMENKKDLQDIFGLPSDEGKFMIGSVGRVVPQKGWDLVLEVLPNLLREREDIQMVVVGRGDDHYCQQLIKLRRQFSKQLGLKLVADFNIPRKVFAGSDAILIASSFEPGGIVAFESMRYGAVPIVRRTGGLNDAVGDFNPVTGRGNGFSFSSRTPWALYGAITEAYVYFTNKLNWHKVVENCLRYDSSWEHSAKRYLEWYREMIYTL